MNESDHDIGDLDAGVVDVVLHFDRLSGGAEHPDERVAEDRVAQMADMGGFVGIDIGVLDDDLFGAARFRSSVAGEQMMRVVAAVETNVEISVPRDLDGGDAFDGNPGEVGG